MGVFAMDFGADILTIDAMELEKQLGEKDPPFVLDVRQPEEYEMGHIQGAILMPLTTLPEHLAEIPKDRRVVVYCRSGRRSERAAAFLKANGFTRIENLTGGIKAWTDKCQAHKNYC